MTNTNQIITILKSNNLFLGSVLVNNLEIKAQTNKENSIKIIENQIKSSKEIRKLFKSIAIYYGGTIIFFGLDFIGNQYIKNEKYQTIYNVVIDEVVYPITNFYGSCMAISSTSSKSISIKNFFKSKSIIKENFKSLICYTGLYCCQNYLNRLVISQLSDYFYEKIYIEKSQPTFILYCIYYILKNQFAHALLQSILFCPLKNLINQYCKYLINYQQNFELNQLNQLNQLSISLNPLIILKNLKNQNKFNFLNLYNGFSFTYLNYLLINSKIIDFTQ